MAVVNVWKATSGAAVETVVETQVATAGQTLFTLVDFEYVLGGNLQVFINGVKQIKGATESYTETTVNTITFNDPIDAGDSVQFINFA